MRSSTETIITALHVLSRDIESPDGVANAAISEAAYRLEELHERNKVLEVEHREFYDNWHACRNKLEDLQASQEQIKKDAHHQGYIDGIKHLESELKAEMIKQGYR